MLRIRRYSLPSKRSCAKRLRQDKKRNERNTAAKSRVATAIKRVKAAGPGEREIELRKAVSAIDRAVKRGVLKKETASRKKSKLMAFVREC